MTDEAPKRHHDKDRNILLNRCLTDLDRIINQHDPEVDTTINNGVWDRLDKLACEVEARDQSGALALVAVERESISEICEDARKMLSRKQAEAFQSGNDVQGHRLHTAQCAVLDVEQAIRALTPADAIAAREARDKQVREQALREVAVNLKTYAPHLEDGPEHDVGYYHGYQTALHRILALIEKGQDR